MGYDLLVAVLASQAWDVMRFRGHFEAAMHRSVWQRELQANLTRVARRMKDDTSFGSLLLSTSFHANPLNRWPTALSEAAIDAMRRALPKEPKERTAL